MLSLFDALHFIIKCRYAVHRNIESYSIKIPVAPHGLEAIVYKKDKYISRGTILAIHGMTPSGNLDPRLENACKALASIGYTVVSPLYKDIQGLWIREKTVEDIASTILAVAADKSLSLFGNLSIFSASFSAGMALIAAAYPNARNLVKAICVIGPYFDAESSIKYLLSSEDNDEYGTFIILRNLLPYSLGQSKCLSAALLTAILDNGYCRGQPELPGVLKTLSKNEQRFFDRLRQDASFRLYHWKKACAKSNHFKSMIKKLSVVRRISPLKAAVSIIHGKEDRVVPAIESMKLYRRLQQYKIPSNLCITNAISHGDANMKFSIIFKIISLMFTFSFFFRYAESKADGKQQKKETLFYPVRAT